MDGILNIDKPAGMTSHDVVDELRSLLSEKKVGHTGTLDPDATGVLAICLGRATKIIQFLEEGEKGYEGTITLGVTTDTLDASGKIEEVHDCGSDLKTERIREVFNSFVGEIEQIPPMVSAIKVKGKRLYRMAREGKTVERKPRKISIYDLEPTSVYVEALTGRVSEDAAIEASRVFTKIDFRVRCSKGTYVRSLAADIGSALGCGAHLSRLVRTKSGMFELKASTPLKEIRSDPARAREVLMSIESSMAFLPEFVIGDSACSRFLNGVVVRKQDVVHCEQVFEIDDPVRVCDKSGSLLGIGRTTVSGCALETLSPQSIICKAARILRIN